MKSGRAPPCESGSGPLLAVADEWGGRTERLELSGSMRPAAELLFLYSRIKLTDGVAALRISERL